MGTNRHNQPLLLLRQFCLFTVVVAQGSSSNAEPLLLWSQRSHVWSKVRGIEGSLDTWINADYSYQNTYRSTEAVANTFRYGEYSNQNTYRSTEAVANTFRYGEYSSYQNTYRSTEAVANTFRYGQDRVTWYALSMS